MELNAFYIITYAVSVKHRFFFALITQYIYRSYYIIIYIQVKQLYKSIHKVNIKLETLFIPRDEDIESTSRPFIYFINNSMICVT